MSKINRYDIGKALHSIRTDLNLTQTEVAKQLNMSSNALSRIENGLRNLSVDELINLLNAYNIPIQSINEIIIQNDKEIINLDIQYNTIVRHYHKYKTTEMHLIHSEIKNFKIFFSRINNDMLFDASYNIQWFTQLALMFPNHFPKSNYDLIENHFLAILKRKNWLRADYIFIANSIPFMKPLTIKKLYTKLIEREYDTLQHYHRREFEMILENLSDYYLVHYDHVILENTDQNLNIIFDKWHDYMSLYTPVENRILYNHNLAMYYILFNKKDKDIILKEEEQRAKSLKNLNLHELAQQLMKETNDYYDGVFGNLNVALFP